MTAARRILHDLTIETVADRLDRSVRWLQTRLAEDDSLRVHHYNGRSPRWDEEEFLNLRSALRGADARKAQERRLAGQPGLKSRRGQDTGISLELFLPETALSASDKVQSFSPRLNSELLQNRSPAMSRRQSRTNSSTASSQPLRFR